MNRLALRVSLSFALCLLSACVSRPKKVIDPSGAGAAEGTNSGSLSPAQDCNNPTFSSLVATVFPYEDRREAVASLVASGSSSGAGCARVLDEALASLAKGEASEELKAQKFGLLLLSAKAKRPGLAGALAAETAADPGQSEWLGALLEADRAAGRRALRSLFAHTAAQVRTTRHVPRLAQDLYGKAAAAEGSEGLADVRLPSPLLFDRYLGELANGGLEGGEAEMGDVLVIYALLEPSARRLHETTLASVAAAQEGAFVSALRREHPLIQFRLLPVLARARTPAFIRELLWVASNHNDARVKTLAASLIDSPQSLPHEARPSRSPARMPAGERSRPVQSPPLP